MIYPQRAQCDFCLEQIKPGQAMFNLEFPMTRAERARVAAELDADRCDAMRPAGILGDIMAHAQPRGIMFQICRVCIEGFLPGIGEKRSAKVDGVIADMRAARQQRADEEAYCDE